MHGLLSAVWIKSVRGGRGKPFVAKRSGTPSGVFSTMTRSISNVALRLSLLAAALALVLIDPAHVVSAQNGGAVAQTSDGAEKEAFNAAKELGTVEAWDAFLSHYPAGFHADLARAYVKRLAGQPGEPAQAPAPGPAREFDYPMTAGTWGGIVRGGPGQDNDKIGSLKEGEEVTLMGPPVSVTPNDYPWFKISFRDGRIGYMWGGLLCSTGAERPDLFKLCAFTPYRAASGEIAAREKQTTGRKASGSERPSWCSSPNNAAERAICGDSDLLSLDGVLNVAYQRAKFDSPRSLDEIEREQRRWLSRRNACGDDPACIRKRYNEQIPLLESFFGN